jgi:hypothetical protein
MKMRQLQTHGYSIPYHSIAGKKRPSDSQNLSEISEISVPG